MTKNYASILKAIVGIESKTDQVRIVRIDCCKLGVSEPELIKALYYLQEGGYWCLFQKRISDLRNFVFCFFLAIYQVWGDDSLKYVLSLDAELFLG